MPDYVIPLPAVEPIYAHCFGRSPARHIAASLAMIAQMVKPALLTRQSPQQLATSIYEQYTGQPDVPSNTIGMTKEQVLAWCASQHIGTIDMAAQLTDLASVKHEFQAQDLSGVVQLFVLADASHLRYARNLQALRNWVEPNSTTPRTTSLVRVGFSTSQPQAYYLDGEAAAAFDQPLPILWQDLIDAGIIGCIAILPEGVSEAPPADFRYFNGVDAEGNLLPPNVWPIPVPPAPVIDFDKATALIATAGQSLAAAGQNLIDAQQRHQELMALLGKG